MKKECQEMKGDIYMDCGTPHLVYIFHIKAATGVEIMKIFCPPVTTLYWALLLLLCHVLVRSALRVCLCVCLFFVTMCGSCPSRLCSLMPVNKCLLYSWLLFLFTCIETTSLLPCFGYFDAKFVPQFLFGEFCSWFHGQSWLFLASFLRF